MIKFHKTNWLTVRYLGFIFMAFVLPVSAVSCKAREADVGQTPKHVAVELRGKNAKVLTFSNWSFDRMNGNNPVFTGKITYNGGTPSQINAFCLQDGMKSNAYLIFNSDLKPGESAKGELHCSQITTPPEKIIVELD